MIDIKIKPELKSGFTLLEIMLVGAIIAILAIAIFGQTIFQVDKARDARRISDMANIKRAMEDKAGDDACYPPPPLPACGSDAWLPYIKNFPCESASDFYYYTDPANPTCPSYYMLFTDLTFEGNAASDDVGCKDGCSYPGASSYPYDYYVASPNAPLPATP